MNVLVTGAAGFIGSTLVDALLGIGDEVFGVDNFDSILYSPQWKERNLQHARQYRSFHFSATDIELYTPTDTIDVIVHLAARPGVQQSILSPRRYIKNIGGTQAVLDLARRFSIPHVILASSSSVYGHAYEPSSESDPLHPLSPYAATKVACEMLARVHHRMYGGTMTVLRFFTVYGPRQRPDLAISRFAHDLLRREPLHVYGDGEATRDFTWVGDTVQGIRLAMERARPGSWQVFNIGSGRQVSINATIGYLSAALNVPVAMINEPRRIGDAHHTFADIQQARDILGYDPSMPFEDGIERYVEWLHEHAGP